MESLCGIWLPFTVEPWFPAEPDAGSLHLERLSRWLRQCHHLQNAAGRKVED